MRDVCPLRIDNPRRITETRLQAKWKFGEQINGFQAMVFCIKTPEGHLF